MTYPVNIDSALCKFTPQTVNVAKSHISELLRNIPSLKMVRNHGHDATIEGTIPVAIGTASYNIPIKLTIPPQYPRTNPSLRVTPTATMYIASGRHIDKYGVVYHPYLHAWNANTSTIYELVCIVSGVFAREPPVYSKPPQGSSPVTQHPTPQPQPGGTTSRDPPVQTPYRDRPRIRSDSNPAEKDEEEKMMEQIKRQSLMELLTQKVKRRIMEISEIDKLKRDYQTLSEGTLLLNELFLNLKRDEARLIQSTSAIAEKSQELDAVIKPLVAGAETERKIDDEVKATAPLYSQLLRIVAEENAIQDTIYQLSRALNNDQISLDEYLKLTRNLSRDQFLKRALILKARGEAGLR